MSKSRIHNDWIKAFVQFASGGEAPTKFYFWTAISTIAGALRRRVWIDQKYFQWVPNCYVVFVAPPGVAGKSTTISLGMSMLKEIPGINFGPDVVTWQKLVEDMGNAQEMVLYEGEEGVYRPMSCLTIASSEFGTFLNPSDKEMVDVLVSLWDGQVGVFKKGTKTGGNDSIENPWINIIACTTPAWLAGNFPEYMVGGGFASRCIWVYADKKQQLVPYPADRVHEHFDLRRKHLLHDLEIISNMKGEFKLSADATALGEEWYEQHWTNPPKDLDESQFGGYIARKQTHIHKIAMILSASRSDELIIHRDILDFSIKMLDALEKDMPKVFDKIGRTAMTKVMGDLVDHIAAKGRMKKQELYRSLSRQVTWDDFTKLLQSAQEAGFVKMAQVGVDVYVQAV